MARNDVKLDEGGIRAFLLNPVGSISRMLHEMGDQVSSVARSVVHVRSGRTKASIDLEYVDGPEYQSVRVEASHAAIFLERGSKPHLIRSHGDWSLHNPDFPLGPENLGFFGREVFHPGNKEYPFLTVGLWSLQTL